MEAPFTVGTERDSPEAIIKCMTTKYASLRPGLQPGLQLARIMECGSATYSIIATELLLLI